MTVSNGAQRSGIGWYGYRRLHSLYKKKPASVRKLVKYRKSNQVRRSFWQNQGGGDSRAGRLRVDAPHLVLVSEGGRKLA